MHAQVIGALNVKGEVCELRWLLTAIHTTALQNFAREACVVPFPWLLSKPIPNVTHTHFADATLVFLQSKQKIPGEGICATGLCYTKTSELSGRPADLFPLQANTILHKSATNTKSMSRFS